MRFTVNIPCLWHLGVVPRFDGYACQVILPLGVFLAICGLLSYNVHRQSARVVEFLPTERVPHHRDMLRPTINMSSPSVHYGVVIDCGSSGSRVFVYWWPPHTGKINQLLDIKPLVQEDGKPLIKKIEPGISTTVNNPSRSAEYLRPLLEFAADAIPKDKHHETPLFVLATAGVRLLSDSDRQVLLARLRADIPRYSSFLFSETHVDVISGKQEAIYAWIAINYALGRFNHDVSTDDHLMLVELPGIEPSLHVRKNTVGIVDMGGGSVQIAMEVPHTHCWQSSKHTAMKDLVSEFSLGCSQTDVDHSYCVYVNTYLNYGSNAARSLYEQSLLSNLTSHQSANESKTSPTSTVSDPCLPRKYQYQIASPSGDVTLNLEGTGDYEQCQNALRHLVWNMSTISVPEIDFRHMPFYGFSEFYYTMEDLLHTGGRYNYRKFNSLAKAFCKHQWSDLVKWQEQNVHPRADRNRYRFQCFKSAWMTLVLHEGLKFPKSYELLTSVQYIQGEEVHWALGALLYKTRYYPLRELSSHQFHRYKPPWLVVELRYANYLVVVCFCVVFSAIFVYIRHLRGWRRDMYRVPTMSYFMTEQDQMEDGLTYDNRKYFVGQYS